MAPLNPTLALIVGSLFGFTNLDLVAVMMALAAIALLGFIVYFNNPKGSTNRAFLWFACATVAYGSANYFNYKVTSPEEILWLLRLTVFTATWHAFSFWYLFLIFPASDVKLPRWPTYVVLPIVVFVSALTLTPLVFSGLTFVDTTGGVSEATQGPLIGLFGITSAVLVLWALANIIRKAFTTTGIVRQQVRVVLVGAAITFPLILVFNLILPLVQNNRQFIPFAPVYFMPFILFTAHAVRRYRMLDTKLVATEILTFVLAAITLIQLIIARGFVELSISIGSFFMVIAFGFMLIRGIIREQHQRDRLRELAVNLRDANARLHELDHLKSQFLSFASHQLKSPLTAIKWQAQLLTDGSQSAVPQDVRHGLVDIERSADNLIAMVNDFLDLRRIEEGRMEYAMELVDALALIRQSVERIRPIADHKKLSLVVEAPEQPCMVRLDAGKLEQVVRNLVDNAIKYTDAGTIVVHVDCDDNALTVTVSDTGRGMAQAVIPKLFEQFVREPGTEKVIEGTGLGLYIAKRIIEAHRGRISARSDGPGKGSEFTFTIPK